MVIKAVSASLLGIVLFVMAWQQAPSVVPAKCCCEKSALDKYQQALEIFKLQGELFVLYRTNNGEKEPFSKLVGEQWDRVRRAKARLKRAEQPIKEEHQRQIKRKNQSSKEERKKRE